MILADKLIQLRKQKGLSQEELADKLDVSRQAVYKWESGQATPDISKLKVLSSIYNVSIDNLLDNSAEIAYANAPKASYGNVIVKEVLDIKAAENDNTKLFPDEAKKLKIRKTVLGVLTGVAWGALALAVLFFVLSGTAENEELGVTYAGFVIPLFLVFLISLIAKGILKKVLFPKVQLARTWYNEELNRVETALKEKFSTVIMLQYDLLAWFAYDNKTNSFGIYFNGDWQFYAPITNYASLTFKEFDTLFDVSIKYFDNDGNLKDYKFALANFREFWIHETDSIEEAECNKMQLTETTKARLLEIKQRLDIEKSRV